MVGSSYIWLGPRMVQICLPQEFFCETEGGKSIHLCAEKWKVEYIYSISLWRFTSERTFLRMKRNLEANRYRDSQSSLFMMNGYSITQDDQPQSNMPFGGVRISTMGDNSTEILRSVFSNPKANSLY